VILSFTVNSKATSSRYESRQIIIIVDQIRQQRVTFIQPLLQRSEKSAEVLQSQKLCRHWSLFWGLEIILLPYKASPGVQLDPGLFFPSNSHTPQLTPAGRYQDSHYHRFYTEPQTNDPAIIFKMEVDLVSDENDYDSYDDTQFDDDNGERASESVHPDSAPRYTIPERVIGAVEIPAIVENPDRAVKTFGRHPHLQHVRSHLIQSYPTNHYSFWILEGIRFHSI
jgi:hypothetical protein